MPVITATLSIPDNEFEWSFSRSSGPGGQNVNKVSSKATLFWNVVESPCLPEVIRQRFMEAFPNKINNKSTTKLTDFGLKKGALGHQSFSYMFNI